MTRRRAGRRAADCRTTAPGRPRYPPAGSRRRHGRPWPRRPAAGRCREVPPARRSPARSPARRRAARGPAAGSRGSRSRAGRTRGSRGRGTRAPRCRVTGSRIPREAPEPRRSWAGRRTPGQPAESSDLHRRGPSNPDRRSRNPPGQAAGTAAGGLLVLRLLVTAPAGTGGRCRKRTEARPGNRDPAAGNRKARRSRGRTARRAVRPGLRAGRSLALIRTVPGRSMPHPNGDAALMAIHCHLELANRSSYTGSLPCLSSSRSMITSIIATNETLCYQLG